MEDIKASIKRCAGNGPIETGILESEVPPYFIPEEWLNLVLEGNAKEAADFRGYDVDQLVNSDYWTETFGKQGIEIADGGHRTKAFRELNILNFIAFPIIPVDDNGVIMKASEVFVLLQVRNILPSRKMGMFILFENHDPAPGCKINNNSFLILVR